MTPPRDSDSAGNSSANSSSALTVRPPEPAGVSAAAQPAAVPERSLDEIEEQIVSLAASIHAATYRLLVLIAEFDEREGWFSGGSNAFRTCAHWLHWRTGISLGAAREKVRTARALRELPVISASMARGELSFSKVRALTRVATPENEEELLGFAHAGTTQHVEHLVRAWRRCDRLDEIEETERRHDQRELQAYFDEDGMFVIRGRLAPEVGAVVLRALEAAEELARGELVDQGNAGALDPGEGVR